MTKGMGGREERKGEREEREERGGGIERRRGREIIQLLAYFSDGHSRQGWARLMSGASCLIWLSNIWAVFHHLLLPSQATSKELDLKWSRKDSLG